MTASIDPDSDRVVEAIVIGASAGALEALSVLLPALPADYPVPILVVVHLRSDCSNMIAELLQNKCAIAVREAEDKEPLLSGTVYIAPPDYHLLVECDKILSLSSEEAVRFSRPSIDVLFETAADAYGRALVGIVLTGANDDGAAGLKAIAAAGGITLVQTPDTAYAAEMPRAAIQACSSAQVMDLKSIAVYLAQLKQVSI